MKIKEKVKEYEKINQNFLLKVPIKIPGVVSVPKITRRQYNTAVGWQVLHPVRMHMV